MTTSGVNVRGLALSVLLAVNEDMQYSHLVLRQVLEKYQYLPKQERAFLTRLVEGTLERLLTLDYVIDAYAKTKVHKMKPAVRNILRMSCYQLLYMDQVPDSAVCNEAVKLVRKRGLSGLSGFVNGVLRTVVREREHISFPDAKKEPVKALAVRFSVPEWIVREWLSDYGREKAEEMLAAAGKEPKITVRANTTKCTAEELREMLTREQVRVEELGEPEDAFVISGFDNLKYLPSFRDGYFYVQDVGSMLAAAAADPKPGDHVIDVCAAPGGKSIHMAELMGGAGCVEARDLTEYRVGLIEENILRHGLTNVKTACMDAALRDAASVNRADVLMCDLPCSGLGVIGRKVDIRYRMNQERAKELVKLQRQILDTVWDYVKPGGTLVYCTCTVRRAENEENVDWFLGRRPEFEPVFQRQIFPRDGHDGFFIAKLVRSMPFGGNKAMTGKEL